MLFELLTYGLQLVTISHVRADVRSSMPFEYDCTPSQTLHPGGMFLASLDRSASPGL